MTSHAELLRRVTIVVLTHNRWGELSRTLDQLAKVRDGGAPDVVVVDNASTDDAAHVVRAAFPDVRLIRLRRNLGGAGRNVGVAAARTPYVAFCDDDTWWAAGSLEVAAGVLDRQPRVAVVCARVLVGPEGRLDDACAQMASSPLERFGADGDFADGYPVLGFLAGACVVRRDAFMAVGGFDERFFIGGEEELLALDLAARGWQLRYVPAAVVHHHPSDNRDPERRRLVLLRNRLWIGLLRYPPPLLARQAREVLAEAGRHGLRSRVLAETARAAAALVRDRRPLPRAVSRQVELLHCHLSDTPGSPA
jgi:GT2 family glycosyltransferase